MSTTLAVGDSPFTHEASPVLGSLSSLAARFIDDAAASIAIFDRDLRYVATSREWIREFGGGRADLVGLRHYDVVPELSESLRAVHRRCLAGESLSAEEDEFVRADGERMWLRWACHPWRTEAGEIGGIVISSEDVTERVQARQALAESDARYRRLVDLLPDAVFLHCDDRVVYANAASVPFFHAASVDDLVGRPVWELVEPSEHDGAHARLGALRRGDPNPAANARPHALAGWEPRA